MVNGDSPSSNGTTAPANASGATPVVLNLPEIGKEVRWVMTLLPTHVTLAESSDVQPYVILREQMMKTAILMEGASMFVLQQPCKVMLKLSAADARAIADWIGESSLAAFYLQRRYRMLMPLAALWVFFSLLTFLPVAPADGVSPSSDPAGLILGLMLLGGCVCARWRPHPALFLLDSIWFGWLAVHLAIRVLHGHSNWWLILVALLAYSTVSGFRHFLRFRRIRIQLPAN